MQVRKAKEEDLERIHSLLCRNFDEVMAKHHSERTIQKYRTDNSPENLANQLQWKTIYVAEQNGDIVGTGAFANMGVVAYPKYTVSNLFVAPDKQSHGVGRAIFEQLLSDAKRNGGSDLHARATANSVGFFLKMGFVVDSEQPDAEDDITWLIMAL